MPISYEINIYFPSIRKREKTREFFLLFSFAFRFFVYGFVHTKAKTKGVFACVSQKRSRYAD